MTGPLVLTGASGFVGRHVLRLLAQRTHRDVRCLTRSPDALSALVTPLSSWRYVASDLRAPDSYAEALAGAQSVLHLAATTGKAPATRYFEMNEDATRALLARCVRAGVPSMVYVSSIAARFPDQRHYPYGRSKAAAEAAVRASGVDYAIIRPTMVLGPQSPILDSLAKLAAGPVAVLFGGGQGRVQPIHVEDLARGILEVVERPPEGGPIEIGGPEVITIEELLRRIRLALRGKRGPLIRIPLQPLESILAALEGPLLPLLPFTAGQLTTFSTEGIAIPNSLTARMRPTMLGLDAMLQDLTPRE